MTLHILRLQRNASETKKNTTNVSFTQTEKEPLLHTQTTESNHDTPCSQYMYMKIDMSKLSLDNKYVSMIMMRTRALYFDLMANVCTIYCTSKRVRRVNLLLLPSLPPIQTHKSTPARAAKHECMKWYDCTANDYERVNTNYHLNEHKC